MLQKTYITLLFLLVAGGSAFAQKSDRDYLRSGNKLYNDSLFVKAEVDYRKALEVNPKSTDAMFNLGNSLLMQQKAKEAMEQFESASKVEKEKDKLAQIYHNMGVILQASKQYPQCIEAYKESLRNNPKDNETRYNLALAQKLLKDQQQNQQNQNPSALYWFQGCAKVCRVRAFLLPYRSKARIRVLLPARVLYLQYGTKF